MTPFEALYGYSPLLHIPLHKRGYHLAAPTLPVKGTKLDEIVNGL